MKKRITAENIDAIIKDAHDLENEEILACQVGNYNLNRYEALMRELDDLKFHIAKFADEGSTLAEINAYDDIISYAEKTFKRYAISALSSTRRISLHSSINISTSSNKENGVFRLSSIHNLFAIVYKYALNFFFPL